jgi:hypothetical protein
MCVNSKILFYGGLNRDLRSVSPEGSRRLRAVFSAAVTAHFFQRCCQLSSCLPYCPHVAASHCSKECILCSLIFFFIANTLGSYRF